MNQAEIKKRQAQAISTMLGLITLAVIGKTTGYNGVTYVAAALEVFAFFYTVVSGGAADTLGRLLRLKNAKGQYRNADRMRRNAMLLQAVLSAAAMAAVLLAAGGIAEGMFRIQYSASILMILAPAILLRTLSSVLAGYLGGEGAELPAAAAGILRQLFILGFGLLFGKMLGNYGSKVSRLLAQDNFTSMYGGVGVAIAVTLTEIFVLLFLLLVYRAGRRPGGRQPQEGLRATASFMDCAGALCGNRAATAGIQLLALLPLPLGLLFFQKAAGGDGAAEYGVYAAGYGAVCGVLTLLVVFLLLPVCGRATALLRREEQRFARTVFQSGVHMGMVHAGFLAVFVFVMAGQLAAVFCSGQAEAGEKMLRGGSTVVLFGALGLYFARTLLLTGKKYLVLAVLAAGNVIYTVTITVMLNMGLGSLSLVCAGAVACVAVCAALGVLTCRQLRIRTDWLRTFVIPAAAACVTGLLGLLLGNLITPHIGNPVTALLCLLLTGVLYWAGLLLLRNFNSQELEIVPGGKLISAAGHLLRVL